MSSGSEKTPVPEIRGSPTQTMEAMKQTFLLWKQGFYLLFRHLQRWEMCCGYENLFFRCIKISFHRANNTLIVIFCSLIKQWCSKCNPHLACHSYPVSVGNSRLSRSSPLGLRKRALVRTCHSSSTDDHITYTVKMIRTPAVPKAFLHFPTSWLD